MELCCLKAFQQGQSQWDIVKSFMIIKFHAASVEFQQVLLVSSFSPNSVTGQLSSAIPILCGGRQHSSSMDGSGCSAVPRLPDDALVEILSRASTPSPCADPSASPSPAATSSPTASAARISPKPYRGSSTSTAAASAAATTTTATAMAVPTEILSAAAARTRRCLALTMGISSIC